MPIDLIAAKFCPVSQRVLVGLRESGVEPNVTYFNPQSLPDWLVLSNFFYKMQLLTILL